MHPSVPPSQRPAPAPAQQPAPKRRRTNSLTLQSLPQPPLRQIFSHLIHPHQPLTPASLRPFLPLRSVCIALRDALDASVTSLDLSVLPPDRFRFFLFCLPRYCALSEIILPPYSFTVDLNPLWAANLPPLRSLTYLAPEHEVFPQYLAHRLALSLEILSTTSASLLTALSRAKAGVHTLELLMDDVEASVLVPFPAHRLRLLYRQLITRHKARCLVSSLRAMRFLQTVHLRLNRLPSDMYALFPHVPGLRSLSLFDGTIVASDRGVPSIAGCKLLEELHLEWLHGLNDDDIITLARGLGSRLKLLRIWNCDKVSDEGLVAVASCCPNAEVELRFVRDQFGSAALAAFGDRVSWGSSM